MNIKFKAGDIITGMKSVLGFEQFMDSSGLHIFICQLRPELFDTLFQDPNIPVLLEVAVVDHAMMLDIKGDGFPPFRITFGEGEFQFDEKKMPVTLYLMEPGTGRVLAVRKMLCAEEFTEWFLGAMHSEVVPWYGLMSAFDRYTFVSAVTDTFESQAKDVVTGATIDRA